MRSLARVVLTALLSTTGLAYAGQQAASTPKKAVVQTIPIQAKASKYAKEAAIVESQSEHYRYNADGTGSLVQDIRVKVQDEAGARAFSVVRLAYESDTQKAKVLSVTVTHPDGTTVVTPSSDDMDLPARVTQEAPLYSDLNVIQVPVRGLRSGDTLDYKVRVDMTKAHDPGEFWGDADFQKKLVVLKEVVTLDVPADKYVKVWDPGLKPVVTAANGRKVYSWSYSQLKTTQELSKKKDDSSSADLAPAIAWTTFKSWQALGAWYRGLAASRVKPTPAIVAKANEITSNAKTPEAQVQAIYDYVSTHIRYIGIDFGIGRFQPHPAEVVLGNRYGDCKDKDTLLEALLRAKGFKTAPALIGAGLKMIPDLPTVGVFNHVITTVTIGGKQIWMDSTPGVEPFQMLVPKIRDKQALVIPESGPAELERTPAKTPFPLVQKMDATATLTTDGDLKAHVVIEDQSDSALLLRLVARNVAPAQWDKTAQYLVRLMGFGGTVSNAEFEHSENLNVPIEMAYDYDHPKFGDWADLEILPLFPVLSLPSVPDQQPSKAIKLGAERTDIANTVIHLPAGFSPMLPDAVHEKTDFATYDRTYSYEKGVLTAKRKVVVLESKIPAKDWQQYKQFVKKTSLFNYTYIQLLTNGTSGAKKAKGTSQNNETAHQLISQANALEKKHEYKRVLKRLDQAKKIAPKQAYLWSNYGWVALQENHLREARKDFERELKNHPDESYVSYLYAVALGRSGQIKHAVAVLKPVVKGHPGDLQSLQYLVFLETQAGNTDLPDVIAVLRQARKENPDKAFLTSELAQYLIQNHQGDEAAPLLVKALNKATDQGTLNNDSYELAQTGKDLALAEKKSREAVKDLEAQTAQEKIAKANQASFMKAINLPADWDTLGYILMKEGKLTEARSYLESAWNNELDPEVALHYGLLLEKQGERTKALRIYELTLGHENYELKARRIFERGTGKIVLLGSPEDRDRLAAAVARLKREHVQGSVKDPEIALQNMRTFHLMASTTPEKFEQATFRLLFSAGAPPEVMKVSGDAGKVQFVKQIEAVHFPELVPKGSKARLLRDAAMSCSAHDRHCLLVLMPMGTIRAENAGSSH